jgi:PilZ domain
MAARDHFRAHARRRVDLGATLRVGRGDAASQAVRVRDLGLGGAGLELVDAAESRPGALPLEREAVVTMEVMAPTLWDPLTLRGKIAWLRRGAQGRPTRLGVRFEHRESAALYALYQLLGAYRYDA